jgi:hypothetical protein
VPPVGFTENMRSECSGDLKALLGLNPRSEEELPSTLELLYAEYLNEKGKNVFRGN